MTVRQRCQMKNGFLGKSPAADRRNTDRKKTEGQRDYYFFTDGSAGSSEATGIYTVRIDKTMPTVTAINASNNTLTFQVADALSGVKSVAVSGNNVTTTLATSSDGKYRFVADKAGDYTILVTDNAGNVNNQYKVDLKGSTQTDTEPPVIGMAKEDSINGSAWYKEDKLVRLTVTDNVGVQSVQVKVQGTEKGLSVENFSRTDIYQFVADKEGAVVYEITARDAAGNKAEMQLTVRVDKSAPTLGAITTQGTPLPSRQTIRFRESAVSLWFRRTIQLPECKSKGKQLSKTETAPTPLLQRKMSTIPSPLWIRQAMEANRSR